MATALPRAMRLSPEACRAHVAAHFDRDLIARQYAALYAGVVATAARDLVPSHTWEPVGRAAHREREKTLNR